MASDVSRDTLDVRASVIARWLDIAARIGHPAEQVSHDLRAFNRGCSRHQLARALHAAEKTAGSVRGRCEQHMAIVLVAEMQLALNDGRSH